MRLSLIDARRNEKINNISSRDEHNLRVHTLFPGISSLRMETPANACAKDEQEEERRIAGGTVVRPATAEESSSRRAVAKELVRQRSV